MAAPESFTIRLRVLVVGDVPQANYAAGTAGQCAAVPAECQRRDALAGDATGCERLASALRYAGLATSRAESLRHCRR